MHHDHNRSEFEKDDCPGMPAVNIVGVSKTYETNGSFVNALIDISLSIRHGEFLVLLGPSGCGKSTLLRMIAGLDLPSAGAIYCRGKEVKAPGRDRGMVFQSYTSFPWLTVRQNVEYGMRLNGVPQQLRRDRAEHFINLVGLNKFKSAYPNQLSGGMKQRVAIARTLANEPEVLLMDEPFGALDPETREQMHDLMLDIMARANTTVVMVTHDIEEAVYLGDRIVFLRRNPGRIRTILEPRLRASHSSREKVDIISSPEFEDTEKEIRGMMRDERLDSSTDVATA